MTLSARRYFARGQKLPVGDGAATATVKKSLEALTQQELDKLSTVDHYPSDSYVFSSHGYDLRIDNELVAEAFASLPEQEQSILILHCVWIWQTEKSAASWNVPQRRPAPQDKYPETVARETDGVNAGGR